MPLDEHDFEMFKKAFLLIDRRLMTIDQTLKKLTETIDLEASLQKILRAIENLDPDAKQRRIDTLLRSAKKAEDSTSETTD